MDVAFHARLLRDPLTPTLPFRVSSCRLFVEKFRIPEDASRVDGSGQCQCRFVVMCLYGICIFCAGRFVSAAVIYPAQKRIEKNVQLLIGVLHRIDDYHRMFDLKLILIFTL